MSSLAVTFSKFFQGLFMSSQFSESVTYTSLSIDSSMALFEISWIRAFLEETSSYCVHFHQKK
jgi:hypothetical protein